MKSQFKVSYSNLRIFSFNACIKKKTSFATFQSSGFLFSFIFLFIKPDLGMVEKLGEVSEIRLMNISYSLLFYTQQ